jgi:hypothetical protein
MTMPLSLTSSRYTGAAARRSLERVSVVFSITWMLGLTVLAHEDGKLEAKWAFGADLCRDAQLYLDGIPHMQLTPSGFVLCLPTMVAKK